MTPEDTDADDDSSVIARSRREPSLFAVIFDRHSRHIHRYLVRRLGPTAADDVLADTFLIAFDKRAKFDPARPDARLWLLAPALALVGLVAAGIHAGGFLPAREEETGSRWPGAQNRHTAAGRGRL